MSRALVSKQEPEVPQAEEVARALEVPLDELAAADAVLVAGVLQKAVEARGNAGLDALELLDQLGQSARASSGTSPSPKITRYCPSSGISLDVIVEVRGRRRQNSSR